MNIQDTIGYSPIGETPETTWGNSGWAGHPHTSTLRWPITHLYQIEGGTSFHDMGVETSQIYVIHGDGNMTVGKNGVTSVSRTRNRNTGMYE